MANNTQGGYNKSKRKRNTKRRLRYASKDSVSPLVDQWGRHHSGGGWHDCKSADTQCDCFNGASNE